MYYAVIATHSVR